MIVYDLVTKVLSTELFLQYNIADLNSGITFIALLSQEKPLPLNERNKHIHTHTHTHTHTRTHALTHATSITVLQLAQTNLHTTMVIRKDVIFAWGFNGSVYFVPSMSRKHLTYGFKMYFKIMSTFFDQRFFTVILITKAIFYSFVN